MKAVHRSFSLKGMRSVKRVIGTEAESIRGRLVLLSPGHKAEKNRVVFLDFMLEIADNTSLPGLARGRMPVVRPLRQQTA